MSLRLTLKSPNVARTIRNSESALRAVVAGVDPLVAAATVYVRVIKALLNIPGTGITRKKRGVSHTASTPGSPPAPDEGELKGGIGFTKTGPRTVGVGIGGPRAQPTSSGRPVWEILERGGRFIKPRPFVRPAIAIAQAEAIDAAVEVLRRRAKNIRKLRGR